ncbi:MAG: helix-turn-helix domain-containing protein [Mucilaginibacter sp.]
MRKIRIDKGLTQKQVADSVGVTEDTITNWENDRSGPQSKFKETIHFFLNKSP